MKTSQEKKSKAVKNIKLSFGADPEFFILDTQLGEIVSAIDVLTVDKYNPIELDEHTKLYYDNAMGEFTIRPASSKEDFVASVGNSLKLINEFFIKKFDGRYKIQLQASHHFKDEYLDHPDARKVGCNPEYSADLVTQIIPPDFNGNLRSAGAHVAIARLDKKTNSNLPLITFESIIDIVKLLDYYLAIPFTLIDNDSTSTERRAIYGSPSSHRPKPEYPGLEYRVLPNYWIQSPKLVELVYDLSSLAVEKYIKGEHTTIFKIDKNQVNAAIKENHKELAEDILNMLNLPQDTVNKINEYRKIVTWDAYKEWGLQEVNTSEVSVNVF
jgi:hypothetical protein